MVDEAIFNAPEIAEAVSGFQTLFGGPGALGTLHTIDVGRGDNLLSIHRAAIEIELQICRHVVGGRVDGPGRAHDDVPVRKRSLAVGVIKRGRRTGSRLEVCRGLHPNRIEKILLHKVFEPLARYFLDHVGSDRRTCVAIGHARPGTPA